MNFADVCVRVLMVVGTGAGVVVMVTVATLVVVLASYAIRDIRAEQRELR